MEQEKRFDVKQQFEKYKQWVFHPVSENNTQIHTTQCQNIHCHDIQCDKKEKLNKICTFFIN